MSTILVAVVQAIVVSVANIDSRHAVAVIASEQVSEASPAVALAILWGFVGAVSAIVISVAVPRRRNATVVGAPEAVLRARSLGAMQRVLVGIVSAVVVAVAEPVRFHADVGVFAFKVFRGASSVVAASLVGLVRGDVILAIVNSIAHLRHRNAAVIEASEFSVGARRVVAVLFVRTVFAVVLVVALPRLENAAAVVATELVRRTRVKG